MAFLSLKTPILNVGKLGVTALFALSTCLFTTQTVFSKTASNTSSDSAKVVDRINKAIKEAEKKLSANPVVEEVRNDIRTNLTPANTGVRPQPKPRSSPTIQPKISATPSQKPAAANNNFRKSSAEQKPPVSKPSGETAPVKTELPPVGFKSADPRRQANEIAWKAHTAYAKQEQYLEAHELTQAALKVDPKNPLASSIERRINRDIRERPMDIGGTSRTISPPDGQVALAVAMSDNVVTLSEAEEIAVKNSMMLESLRHRAAGARGKVNEALRAFLPTLNFDISNGGGVVSDTPYASEKYMGNFSQPVFYGGELIFTLKQAQASLRSDELKYDKERTDIMKQVGEAYRNAVNAVYNLRYQEELYKQIQEHKLRNDKTYESKLVAEIDHLEISSIFNQVSFQKESAITTQKSANLTLCQALGVKADLTIPVDPTVEVSRLSNVDLDEYLNNVGQNNFDIRIKQATLESAYYGTKVFDAQRMPRVDFKGSFGLGGEERAKNDKDYPTPSDHTYGQGGRPDLEREYSMIASVTMPLGANTVGYTNQRRFFAPTVSSFQGSTDYKNSVTLGVLDRLSNRTDEEIAKADYLKAMAELQKERTDQEINARQAYYDYESALLQLEASEAKIIFRERQTKILEQTTRVEEAKLTELLNELVSLAEDRYSKITAISSANNALAKMEYLAGMEGINTRHEIKSSQK